MMAEILGITQSKTTPKPPQCAPAKSRSHRVQHIKSPFPGFTTIPPVNLELASISSLRTCSHLTCHKNSSLPSYLCKEVKRRSHKSDFSPPDNRTVRYSIFITLFLRSAPVHTTELQLKQNPKWGCMSKPFYTIASHQTRHQSSCSEI